MPKDANQKAEQKNSKEWKLKLDQMMVKVKCIKRWKRRRNSQQLMMHKNKKFWIGMIQRKI